MLSDNIILVPNAKLGSAIVTNFSFPQKEMNMTVPVGVSYSSDLDKVEKVTLEVARETLKETAGGVAGFEPAVRYNNLGDSAIQFNVVLRVKDFTNQYLVTHEFIKKLHKRYNKEGIDLPFPQRVVHLVNEEKK
jgi:small-conductance mechanosensitive channel